MLYYAHRALADPFSPLQRAFYMIFRRQTVFICTKPLQRGYLYIYSAALVYIWQKAYIAALEPEKTGGFQRAENTLNSNAKNRD